MLGENRAFMRRIIEDLFNTEDERIADGVFAAGYTGVGCAPGMYLAEGLAEHYWSIVKYANRVY